MIAARTAVPGTLKPETKMILRNHFMAAVIIICVFISYRLLLSAKPPPDRKMNVKLVIQDKAIKLGQAPSAFVEIKNTSKENLRIVYNAHPFEHLDIAVINPEGKLVSEGRYGHIFSPATPKPQAALSLRPGESYRFTVNLFARVQEPQRAMPGVYVITAIYEYNQQKVSSEPVSLAVEK